MRKKGFFKKALIYSLVGAIIAGNVTPAYAATSVAGVNETQDVSTDDFAECEVYAQLGTEFKVIIPKKITLSGSSKSGTYTVDVEGDIGGTDTVKVVPEESFTLTSTGLASQTAKVSQDKTAWSWNEILPDSKTIGQGSISASGISAGAWNGSFWFNISLEEGTGSGSGSETESKLTLSTDDVKMGTGDSVQVNAYLDGVKANEAVTWSSDNENITVTNGLIETTAGAEVGDTATVTVTASSTENLSAMANVLSDLGIVTYASAAEDLSIDFVVTIVDIEYSVEELNLKAGESIDVTARIIPNTVTGTVTWSQTAISGINLVKNGNTVTIKVASDMEAGKSYNLVATYGDYSKTLKINIVSDVHTHSYTGTVTKEATCTEDGVKTFTCECGDSYTEVITATGHSFKNGSCTECGEADPDYVALVGGLYDANDNLLCSWEDSGINVGKNYTSSNYKKSTTSGYYVITKNYPTTAKVVIPEGITSIGSYAFYDCTSLTSVEIPSSVTTIGDLTFRGCTSLTSIEIPSSVTSIGDRTFIWCSSLSSITVDKNNANYCSVNGVLFSKDITTLVVYPEGKTVTSYIIPNSVTSIGTYAFTNCTSLTSVEIPDSVTNIGKSAFYNCTKLTIVTFKNTSGWYRGTSAGSYSASFSSSNLADTSTAATYLKSTYSSYYWTYVHKHSYTSSVTKESTCADVGIKTFTCECGDSYTETIPATGEHNYVDHICTKCGSLKAGLYDADGVMLCTWEESGINVTKDYLTSYTQVTYDDYYKNSTTSGYYVLTNNYPTATKVAIPDSITSIGSAAFRDCTNLTRIEIPNGVTSIGNQAFYGCTSLKNFEIPNGVTSIGNGAFGSCSSLTSIEIPDSVTGWNGATFNGCTSLTSVTIGNGVTSIGNSDFAYCTNLASVTIGKSVTGIGQNAFNGCSKLTSIDIPDSVTSIGHSAFYKCTGLTNVTIGSGVTSIGEAFGSCTSLTSITIPSSVKYISSHAFGGCINLTSVTFETTSGWYIARAVGELTTALNSDDLANTSTAATYLTDTYRNQVWRR